MALPAAVIPALQYGLPAAIQLVEIGSKWIKYWTSDSAKVLTQPEYNAKWAEMQSDYKQVTDAHEALRKSGR